jgi:DnaJ-class molecular chaperone
MSPLNDTEWKARLAQADKLRDAGTECAMCDGTGGWPGTIAWVPCMPCNGTGTYVPTSLTLN